MGDIRIHRGDPGRFVKIPNDTAFGALSWAALGYLAETLARKPDWEGEDVNAAAARRRAQVGPERAERANRVRTVFAELEAAGYRHRVLRRGPGGTFATETHYYDRPAVPCEDAATCRTCKERPGGTESKETGGR